MLQFGSLECLSAKLSDRDPSQCLRIAILISDFQRTVWSDYFIRFLISIRWSMPWCHVLQVVIWIQGQVYNQIVMSIVIPKCKRSIVIHSSLQEFGLCVFARSFTGRCVVRPCCDPAEFHSLSEPAHSCCRRVGLVVLRRGGLVAVRWWS